MKFNFLLASAMALCFYQTTAESPLGEADLIESLGWGKTESQALTQFLASVDQLGELVQEQEQGDNNTTALVNEFRGHAQELMAHAVYEYLQLANNPRVLSRLSSEEGLVMNFLDTLNKLISKVRAPGKPLSDILKIFNNIKKAFENPFFPMDPSAGGVDF
ncbi:hypothetical protein BC941DRAFT_509729 [Chlamydoabsidia padenii]|nr:hypothetical protein BC941DRAFT_509729 [Chlamydoabsidia padenii]